MLALLPLALSNLEICLHLTSKFFRIWFKNIFYVVVTQQLTPRSPPDDDGGIRARHSSMLVAKSTSIRGSLTSPIISCLENRSKSYSSIRRVLFVMSL